MVGARISQYEITAELGRGGMGIVYKAHDTVLDREVALKVLPAAALVNATERERFYREARSAAALNHPHIASVYQIDEAVPEGVETRESQPFIAMEFVDGERLDERLQRGPLAVKEAVRLVIQIASALQEAHEHGIVHRDVKSSNLMLTAKGDVKVLDFGLAVSSSATRLTRVGSTVGTIHYMSPEQARGEEVNGRTDLWALGVVFYEMLTGQLPFSGSYEQAVIYAILNTDAEPVTGLRSGIPVQLEWILDKCLEKDVDLRYQHADDLIADLKALDGRSSRRSVAAVAAMDAAKGAAKGAATDAGQPATRNVTRQALIALIGLFLFAAGAFLQRQIFPGPSSDVWSLPLDTRGWNSDHRWPVMAVSPDGRVLVHVVDHEGAPHLFLRHLDGSGSRILDDTEGASYPVFSPDGVWIAFVADRQIKKVLLSGGASVPVTSDIGDHPGLDWSEEDRILFSVNWSDGIHEVAPDGSNRRQIIEQRRDLGEGGFSYASLLPDGKTVLCTIYGNGFDVAAIDLESGDRTILARGGIHPTYSPTGHVFFVQGSDLMAMEFDPKTLRAGNPVPVVADVITDYVSQAAQYSLSTSGTLVYLTGETEWNLDLLSVDFSGAQSIVMEEIGQAARLEVSPDGNRVLMNRMSPTRDSDVFMVDMSTAELIPVSHDFGYEGNAVWHEEAVLYQSFGVGRSYIISARMSETVTMDTVLVDDASLTPYSVSGGYLYYTRLDAETGADIWRLDLSSPDAAPESVVSGRFHERWPTPSPDGRTMAFTSNESGLSEVYVRPVGASGRRERVSMGGGSVPRWSADGAYLYYQYGNDLMRARRTSAGMAAPERVSSTLGGAWDLLKNGRGYLSVSLPSAPSAVIKLNWLQATEKQLR